ncbi:hypothetical protein ACFVH9_20900 [Streptomyces hirsutus]
MAQFNRRPRHRRRPHHVRAAAATARYAVVPATMTSVFARPDRAVTVS